MELIIQIKSLLFSFAFGILFSCVVNIFNNKLYNSRLRYQIINACLMSIISCLIYFICIKKINNGIIHIYFIMMIIFGFITEKKLLKINYRIIKIKNKFLVKKQK